ncbi:hypothetical protein WN944_020732 [Citrus x changshan-huyou]|uniref:Uncharacterized protein n=1 Tax=Citrus x changshan-huyou TaxID=2935761 RepID=A0AAP0LZ37_9ROSI
MAPWRSNGASNGSSSGVQWRRPCTASFVRRKKISDQGFILILDCWSAMQCGGSSLSLWGRAGKGRTWVTGCSWAQIESRSIWPIGPFLIPIMKKMEFYLTSQVLTVK